MDKDIIIQKVKEKKYTHEELLKWLAALPSSTEKRKPSEFKVGDVIMHYVFKHPYILLYYNKKENNWLCGLLTTDEEYPDVVEKCESRFFNNSFITKTLFIVTDVKGTFLNCYDNKEQLNRIKNELKNKILK